MVFDSDYCFEHCCPVSARTHGISLPSFAKPNIMSFVFGAALTCMSVKKKRHQIVISETFILHEFERIFRVYSIVDTASCATQNTSDANNEQRFQKLILWNVWNLLWLFKKASTETLPFHQPYDHRILFKKKFYPTVWTIVQYVANRTPSRMKVAAEKLVQKIHSCLLVLWRCFCFVHQKEKWFITFLHRLPKFERRNHQKSIFSAFNQWNFSSIVQNSLFHQIECSQCVQFH